MTVRLASSGEDTLTHAPGAQVVGGQWRKGELEVERPGPRGGKVTQTFRLEEKGDRLVIETRLSGMGDMPDRSFKRVYDRVTSS